MSPVEDRSEGLEKDGRFGESRRKFLQRSAGIGVGLAALYAPPQVRTTGVPKAYATGTQVDVAPPDAGSQQIYWSSQAGASVGGGVTYANLDGSDQNNILEGTATRYGRGPG